MWVVSFNLLIEIHKSKQAKLSELSGTRSIIIVHVARIQKQSKQINTYDKSIYGCKRICGSEENMKAIPFPVSFGFMHVKYMNKQVILYMSRHN